MLPVAELESRLGYRFSDIRLLTRALTHRSRGSEEAADTGDNEQLEFLGDSVLGFVTSETLVKAMPDGSEGTLSQIKSHLVSASHLHRCALDLGLGEHIRLGRGEELSGGRARKSVLADALEAVIAAVYLDGGMEAARNVVRLHVLNAVGQPVDLTALSRNHKSTLQEKALAMGLPMPRYVTVGSSGPEHAKQFTVEGRIGNIYSARASASSKKAASQGAAELLLAQITKDKAEQH